MLVDPVSGEALLSFLTLHLLALEGTKELSRVSLIRTAIPSLRDLPSSPDHPKALPLNAISMGVRISAYEFGGCRLNTDIAIC